MLIFEDWVDFRECLRVLAKSNKKKLFDCPFLAVLSEEIRYKRSDAWESKHYAAGSLFCSEKAEPCATRDNQCALILNEKGEIVIPCSYNGSNFTFLLAGFKTKK